MRPHRNRCARLLLESLDDRALPAVPFGPQLDRIDNQESLDPAQRVARDSTPPNVVGVRGDHWFSGKPDVRDEIRDAREAAREGATDEGLEHRRSLVSAPAVDQPRATEPDLRARGEDTAMRRADHSARAPNEPELAVAANGADFKLASPIPILMDPVWLQPFAGDDSDWLPSERDTVEPHAPMSYRHELPAPTSDPEKVTLAIPLPVAGSLPFDSGLIADAVHQLLNRLSNIGVEFSTEDDFIEIAVWSAAGLLAGGAVGSMVNDWLGRYRAGPWPQSRINPETGADRTRPGFHSKARD